MEIKSWRQLSLEAVDVALWPYVHQRAESIREIAEHQGLTEAQVYHALNYFSIIATKAARETSGDGFISRIVVLNQALRRQRK